MSIEVVGPISIFAPIALAQWPECPRHIPPGPYGLGEEAGWKGGGKIHVEVGDYLMYPPHAPALIGVLGPAHFTFDLFALHFSRLRKHQGGCQMSQKVLRKEGYNSLATAPPPGRADDQHGSLISAPRRRRAPPFRALGCARSLCWPTGPTVAPRQLDAPQAAIPWPRCPMIQIGSSTPI